MQVRTPLIAMTLALVPLTALHAQTGDGHKGHAAAPQTAAAHKATGVVKNLDRSKNTVMLAHDPVPSLKWPAMTMSFAVKDKTLLDKLPASGKIEFEFVQQGRDYVITAVK